MDRYVPSSCGGDMRGCKHVASGVVSTAPGAGSARLRAATGRQPLWPYRYVAWPDFGLPDDEADADDAILEAFMRVVSRRGRPSLLSWRSGPHRYGAVVYSDAVWGSGH